MRRDVFQAIADPTRRAIILLIAAQAMTPNTIAEHFDTSRQAAFETFENTH
jgi:DNA-binding transcriptional ArsR family regulator